MPVFSARSPALDGVSWVQGGEVENAVGLVLGRVRQNRRRRLLPPSGVAPCGSSMRSPVSVIAGLRGEELRSVPQHRMHDDGEATRQGDARLAHC